MRVFKVSELLGVDAATTSWNMKIGKKKAGEDFVPGPGQDGGALGGGGVGEGGGLSGLFASDTVSIGAAAPTPAPAPAPSAGGGASDVGDPADQSKQASEQTPAPAERDKIMSSDLDESTKKSIAALHKTLEAVRYETHMQPSLQRSAPRAGGGRSTGGGRG